jgi:hypothetical protein
LFQQDVNECRSRHKARHAGKKDHAQPNAWKKLFDDVIARLRPKPACHQPPATSTPPPAAPPRNPAPEPLSTPRTSSPPLPTAPPATQFAYPV